MNLKALVTKYIVSAEQVLNELQRSKGAIIIPEENVINILEYIINYLEDAKYYKEQKKFETSLVSVAYCEGLLDALRLMGAVKFEWPVNEERKK